MASSCASIICAVLVLFSIYSLSHAVPLSAKSRWVVDDKTGKRVKLVCGNLVGHTEHLLPEGVSSQPVREIAKLTRMMGLNCIRLTYSVYMFTRLQNVIVAENLGMLGLNNATAGIARNNPHLLTLTLVQAQKAVIDDFTAEGVMVVLDNQVSKPMWCCGNDDGNGFWGDKFFDPQEWLLSLKKVAYLYKNNPMVIGMSLRNEIRGPRQNESLWYKNMEMGAKAINAINPNMLVIFGGLNYAIKLDFLKSTPLNLSFMNKVVYEFHRYSFSEGNQNILSDEVTVNRVCQTIIDEVEELSGFLSGGNHPAPIFVSEWGVNQVENFTSEHTFFACFLNYLAEHDYDWALWALQGTYIYRQGVQDMPEYFGMFNTNWDGVQNPDVNAQLELVMRTNQDPFSTLQPYQIIFHAYGGKCLRVSDGQILFDECVGMSRWNIVKNKNTFSLELQGGGGCLTAVGDGLPVALTKDCNSPKSSWSRFDTYQLSYVDDQGMQMCLDFDPYYSLQIVTKKCIVESDGVSPLKQWFGLISSNAE